MNLTQTRPALLIRHFLRTVEIDGLRGAIVQACRRVKRSFGRHGVRGTLSRTIHSAPVTPAIPAPAQPEAGVAEVGVPGEPSLLAGVEEAGVPGEASLLAGGAEAPHPFDLLHGTDTAGCLAGAVLPPTSLSALLITGYIGIGPSALIQAIEALPFKPQDYSFIDLGCGKGRALMVATQFPFRSILGVELDPELCRIARANIARKADWAARITLLQQDAATFIFPEGPLLIFLYHPFLPRILGRVLANLERQLRRSPRETWVLYGANPRYTRILNRFPFLREIAETQYALSPEDAAVNYFELSHERFTLYHADLAR